MNVGSGSGINIYGLGSSTPSGGVLSIDGEHAVNNVDPENPIIEDLLIGRTLIVSTLGDATGEYTNLTWHFNDINLAIAAVQSVNDVIIVHPCTSADAPDFTGQWSVNAAVVSYPPLNIKCVNKSVFIVFNDGLPGCTDLNISGNGQIQFNVLLEDATTVNVECASFSSSVDLFVDGGNYKFDCAETFNVTTARFAAPINLYVTAVRATVSEALILSPIASIVSFKCHEYYGTLDIDDTGNEDWKYIVDAPIHYGSAIDKIMISAIGETDITSKLIIKGDMSQTSNLVMIELNTVIWKKESGNITHSIITNNASTQDIPIVNLINSATANAGFIGKGCNLISINGQRKSGVIICNNAFGMCYVQIDSMNAQGDAAITSVPFVITAVAANNIVDLKGMCNATLFSSWLDANCVSLLGGSVDVPGLII